MKKLVVIFVCLIMLGLGVACGSAKDSSPAGEWIIVEESSREFTNALQLRITEIDVSQNRVIYEVSNCTDDVYGCGTGADFSLEVLQDGVWHKMRHEPGWAVTMELHILNPGETKEFSTGLMSELAPGTYRFLKEVGLEESPGDKEFIGCEFVME